MRIISKNHFNYKVLHSHVKRIQNELSADNNKKTLKGRDCCQIKKNLSAHAKFRFKQVIGMVTPHLLQYYNDCFEAARLLCTYMIFLTFLNIKILDHYGTLKGQSRVTIQKKKNSDIYYALYFLV